MKIRDRVLDFGFWFGWNVLWILPEKLSRKIFDMVAIRSWKRQIRGVAQLELNLSRVVGCEPSDPRIRELSLSAMRSYMRYYCETFLLPRWSDERLISSVRVENVEQVQSALHTGGVILTLPHTGNWDHAGAWCAKYLGSLATVAERLRPEGVFQKFLKMRTQRGMTLMPLTGEGGTYEFLRDNVNQGKVVALLGDRDVARNGMSNSFFDHKASLPIGAAVLAIDTGRPLFTCCPWYDGDTLVVSFDAPVPVVVDSELSGRDRLRKAQEITAIVAQRFEGHIKAHPGNWHQLQPVWNDLVVNA